MELFFENPTGTLTMSNECAEPLNIDSVSLRTPHEAFLLLGGPANIEANGEETLTVEFTASGNGLYEEILLIEVSRQAPDIV